MNHVIQRIALWRLLAASAETDADTHRKNGMYHTAGDKRLRARLLRECADELEECVTLDGIPTTPPITAPTEAEMEEAQEALHRCSSDEKALLKLLGLSRPPATNPAAASAGPPAVTVSDSTKSVSSMCKAGMPTPSAGTPATSVPSNPSATDHGKSSAHTPHPPHPSPAPAERPDHSKKHSSGHSATAA